MSVDMPARAYASGAFGKAEYPGFFQYTPNGVDREMDLVAHYLWDNNFDPAGYVSLGGMKAALELIDDAINLRK